MVVGCTRPQQRTLPPQPAHTLDVANTANAGYFERPSANNDAARKLALKLFVDRGYRNRALPQAAVIAAWHQAQGVQVDVYPALTVFSFVCKPTACQKRLDQILTPRPLTKTVMSAYVRKLNVARAQRKSRMALSASAASALETLLQGNWKMGARPYGPPEGDDSLTPHLIRQEADALLAKTRGRHLVGLGPAELTETFSLLSKNTNRAPVERIATSEFSTTSFFHTMIGESEAYLVDFSDHESCDRTARELSTWPNLDVIRPLWGQRCSDAYRRQASSRTFISGAIG